MSRSAFAAAAMIAVGSAFSDLPFSHHRTTDIPVDHAAEAERIRAADQRRKAKAARQAKGFRS